MRLASGESAGFTLDIHDWRPTSPRLPDYVYRWELTHEVAQLLEPVITWVEIRKNLVQAIGNFRQIYPARLLLYGIIDRLFHCLSDLIVIDDVA